MNIPDFSQLIKNEDVSQKGTGNYKADYVNWAKVAHLLNANASGWQFHLRLAPDGGHVWKAPNNTGYLVGYFTSPDNEATADFPQAIMDNRNAPIAFDKISARDVTDTHRRALCAAACFTFGLAYQLWAKEAIEDPMRETEPVVMPAKNPATVVDPPSVISESQLKRLMAIAKEHGVTDGQQKEIVTNCFGFTSRKLITKEAYEDVVLAYQAING